jgi:hypothetical protein
MGASPDRNAVLLTQDREIRAELAGGLAAIADEERLERRKLFNARQIRDRPGELHIAVVPVARLFAREMKLAPELAQGGVVERLATQATLTRAQIERAPVPGA